MRIGREKLFKKGDRLTMQRLRKRLSACSKVVVLRNLKMG